MAGFYQFDRTEARIREIILPGLGKLVYNVPVGLSLLLIIISVLLLVFKPEQKNAALVHNHFCRSGILVSYLQLNQICRRNYGTFASPIRPLHNVLL
jgi:hypothetical protein